MKRHRELSILTREGTSLGRATSFNKSKVEKFFDNLSTVINCLKIGPKYLYITSMKRESTRQKPDHIVVKRGFKQIVRITSQERGTLVTLAVAV